MTLDNLMTMAKADRYTEDGRNAVNDARRTYKPGEISEATGLQKQNDGSWAPPKAEGGEKKEAAAEKGKDAAVMNNEGLKAIYKDIKNNGLEDLDADSIAKEYKITKGDAEKIKAIMNVVEPKKPAAEEKKKEPKSYDLSIEIREQTEKVRDLYQKGKSEKNGFRRQTIAQEYLKEKAKLDKMNREFNKPAKKNSVGGEKKENVTVSKEKTEAGTPKSVNINGENYQAAVSNSYGAATHRGWLTKNGTYKAYETPEGKEKLVLFDKTGKVQDVREFIQTSKMNGRKWEILGAKDPAINNFLQETKMPIYAEGGDGKFAEEFVKPLGNDEYEVNAVSFRMSDDPAETEIMPEGYSGEKRIVYKDNGQWKVRKAEANDAAPVRKLTGDSKIRIKK